MMNKQAKQQEQSTHSTNELLAFPDELAFFTMLNKKIDTALAEALSKVDQVDKEYMDFKQYMADYRGEIDPHEMFQNSMILKQIDQGGAFKVDVWKKLKKTKDSPYFASIHFQEDNEELAEKLYIGRFSFMYEHELLIVDWRSPIASMFYDYEVGPAEYLAPMGRITGHLLRKRQFKIEDGILQFVLESSLNIQDNLLQRVLSHTSNEKMKSIISTIQKEQNIIIRDEQANVIIIQGVAGSGKTSIALHRISFLLYRFKDRLSAKNITILSPNKVFGDYISTVLPELGDEPIYESSFEEIASIQLHGTIKFISEKAPIELKDEAMAKRITFKSTLAFVHQLDTFLQEITTRVFVSEAYTFQQYTIPAEDIQKRFGAYRTVPFKKRLRLVADDLQHQLVKECPRGEKLPSAGMILKSLNKMLHIKNSLTLYKEFYKWVHTPDMLVLPEKHTLEWNDVYPFLYIHSAYAGLQTSTSIKHVVIDEMQDYTPIQYAVINRLFPCQKTILGDFGQRIHPNHLHTLQDLQTLFQDAKLVELIKSYRSTYEIITFANSIQQAIQLEPIERHGDIPLILSCRNERDMFHKIEEKLQRFHESEYTSLGIIVKTQALAQSLYEQLTLRYKINLVTVESTSFHKGISITSIHMSKGLEFDEVLLLDVNDENYHNEYDKNLLYIAATRAMHRLTLLYTGNPSPFISTAINREARKEKLP